MIKVLSQRDKHLRAFGMQSCPSTIHVICITIKILQLRVKVKIIITTIYKITNVTTAYNNNKNYGYCVFEKEVGKDRDPWCWYSHFSIDFEILSKILQLLSGIVQENLDFANFWILCFDMFEISAGENVKYKVKLIIIIIMK